MPEVTQAMIDAAQDATGYDVDAARVSAALAECPEDMRAARSELEAAEIEFDEAGSRGVELAERIDTLRIAIAARDVDDAPGILEPCDCPDRTPHDKADCRGDF